MFSFTKNKINTQGDNNRIFLDYASTTPISDNVREVMLPFLSEKFHNPSSIHKEGVDTKKVIESARDDVAKVLSVKTGDIYFTNGGTESANLAILGVARNYLEDKDFSKNAKPHLIVGKTEHPAVLEAAKHLEDKEGVDVTYLDVNEKGSVNVDSVIKALTKNTVLVSVMYVNNEIGSITAVGKISRAIREWKKENNIELENYPFVHTDASQAPNYLSVQVEKLGVDLMTLDGSKIYGPKSSGILFKKQNVPILPIMFGGNQEEGLRSGTENVAAIVGFAKALTESQDMSEMESERLTALRDYFIDEVLEYFSKKDKDVVSLNGSKENRIANNINFCFKDHNGEFMVLKLDAKGVSVVSTTACKSLEDKSFSYVIEALGKEGCESSSIRFTLGRSTTKEDLDKTLNILKEIV